MALSREQKEDKGQQGFQFGPVTLLLEQSKHFVLKKNTFIKLLVHILCMACFMYLSKHLMHKLSNYFKFFTKLSSN